MLIATGKNEIHKITVSENSHSGYLYNAGLEKLLSDYDAKSGKVTFFKSARIKKKHITENFSKEANHTMVIYPENHSILHIGDIFFSIRKIFSKKSYRSHCCVLNAANIKSMVPHFIFEKLSSEGFFILYKSRHRITKLLPRHSPEYAARDKISNAERTNALADHAKQACDQAETFIEAQA